MEFLDLFVASAATILLGLVVYFQQVEQVEKYNMRKKRRQKHKH